MKYCNVIVNQADGTTDSNTLIVGEDTDKVGRKAEKLFIEKCKEFDRSLADWDVENPGDRGPSLDDGYYNTPDGHYICITWPEVVPAVQSEVFPISFEVFQMGKRVSSHSVRNKKEERDVLATCRRVWGKNIKVVYDR